MFSCSITLILVATDDGSCDDHMTYLLELVFNAMVMVIGLQDLDTPTNMERLKQNLKVSKKSFLFVCQISIFYRMEKQALYNTVTRCICVG